jgi:Pyruvate/2-oxoacid:ferredoxin oxidoreductase delta subunit
MSEAWVAAVDKAENEQRLRMQKPVSDYDNKTEAVICVIYAGEDIYMSHAEMIRKSDRVTLGPWMDQDADGVGGRLVDAADPKEN